MNISVVLPAYNEEQIVQETVCRCIEALQSLFDEFELIIVDDGSTDNTGEVAEALALEHPEIRVIHNERNVGQGASLLTGFKNARFGFVTHNAMDYPFRLDDLSKFLSLLDRADIIVGVRRARTDYSPYRKLVSALNLFLLHLLFDLRLRDYNFVQLYKKEVLETIVVESTSTGFVIPETLIRAHDLGYRIEEVEVDYSPREWGEARSGHVKVIIQTVYDLFKFWLKRMLRRGIARA